MGLRLAGLGEDEGNSMRYADGRDARLGDRVELWEGGVGRVVCSLDTNEFGESFPRERWSHLRSGVLVQAEAAGLLHYKHADETLKLLSRAHPGQ